MKLSCLYIKNGLGGIDLAPMKTKNIGPMSALLKKTWINKLDSLTAGDKKWCNSSCKFLNQIVRRLKLQGCKAAEDFLASFRKLKLKCQIPMEEKHFIKMAQSALRLPLGMKTDDIQFRDFTDQANRGCCRFFL